MRLPGLLVVAFALAGSPASGATLFGLIDTGELFSSGDGGVVWTVVATLPVHDATALQARNSATDLYLASRSGSVYHSGDGGSNWAAVGAVTASDVADLVIRRDGGILLLTTSGTVYESNDLGVSFAALAALSASDFTSLCQRSDDRLYALTRTGGVYESIDGGTVWTAKSAITFADGVRIRSLVNDLFALTDAGDLYRSDDAGTSWSPIGTLSQVGMRGLVADDATLVAASKEGHVWTSANGVAWTVQGSMQQLTLTALASDHPAVTGVEETPGGALSLGAPWPNPSHGAALSLPLRLERDDTLELRLFDLAGREVASRPPEPLPAGAQVIAWQPGVRAAGLYLVRARLGSGPSGTRRWVVLE